MFADVPHAKRGKMAGPPAISPVAAAYALFGACAFCVFHFVANGHFSSVLTMSVMFQCLAFVLLGLHTSSRGDASGISARSLALEALSFACKLSSTTWLNGYLPVDASGDLVYQAVDACSLLLVCWLLHVVLVQRRATYDAAADTLPVGAMVLCAFVLAAILHADMNARPFFDTLWMAGLFLGVVAVLPQLWLVTRKGGTMQACTSHYIAMLAVSRVLSGGFMWHARRDITCAPWVEGVNHAIWAILAAHAVHLLLLGDFAYYYVRAVAQQGLDCKIELGPAFDMV